ncbi:NAD(P)/FAD-dependent oxidoreductase, partial [Allorhizocola rhizosphaerae]|uniref:NAD(P)/FAD-dependent oxidoreductase n=1 Tax=Allorhizocola rhizosphaerae TaxID=1872709 RepID=UPI000E3E4604
MTRFDVIVIGAGPAGLAAAVAACSKRVLLLDSAPRPGGQYWRHRAGHEPRSRAFRALVRQLGRIDYRPNSSVWFVEPGFTVHTRDASYSADRLVIATGAYDRSLPFPGWDLPGVVTAGGAQALLKGQGVAIGQRVVVSGAGPFLLPVAAGLARAGVRVMGVFEAGRPQAYLRHRAAFAKAFEALGYGLSLARHRIPYFTGHRVVAAHGERRLEAVTVNARTVECDALAVGYGFTPQVELALALGCETTLDDDGSLIVAETHQAATTPGVYVAGEVTGVGGAALALVEGRLAGLAAADR